MELDRVEQLLEKYYEATTTVAEEDVLRAYFTQEDVAPHLQMHAPLFHPAMKHIAPVRKEMQVRTFFNILGPMINPSFPKHQFLGVFNLEILRLYGYLYQESNVNYGIVHAMDGYDEISLTSPVKVMDNTGEHVYQPSDFGFKQLKQEQLHGGDTVESAAGIFKTILSGEGTTAQNQAVLSNAGLAIATVKQSSFSDGIDEAKESLSSGKALQSFKNFISINS